MSVKEVFLDLVSMGSGSDETSETTPSTSSQKVLGAHLVEHMKAIGIADAYMDEEPAVCTALFPPQSLVRIRWVLSPTWTPMAVYLATT